MPVKKPIQFRFRYSYAREPRKNITTSINAELHKKLSEISYQYSQPMSKCYDIMIMEIMKDEETIEAFMKKVREY
jgi:hypothetical protein